MGKLMQFGLSAALILLFGFAATKSESKDFPVAEGYVRETVTNKPIAGAYVTLFWYGRKKHAGWLEAEVVVKTDVNGRFFHQAPIRNAEGWRTIVRAYLPGYQMFQFLEFDNRTLFRVIDKYDDEGVERTYAQMLALGYEYEPINKLTISGWVERRAMPSWFRKSAEGTLSPFKRSPDGPVTIYMEKADMAMNERIQEIKWTSQSSSSVNQRLGPFTEYDRLRFSEATDLLCKFESNISVNTYNAYERLYEDWDLRVKRLYDDPRYQVIGYRQFGIPVPSQFETQQRALQALRSDNISRRNYGGKVLATIDYEVLCKSGRHHLAEVKP